MTDEKKIYIAYGETMHTFQLLELQFQQVLVFLNIEQYDNPDELWADMEKWKKRTAQKVNWLSWRARRHEGLGSSTGLRT